jgi:multisubunit Na+/H+ antiporter MnhB subunit
MLELILVILGTIGSFIVSYSLKSKKQMIGMIFWAIANLLSIIFFAFHGMIFLCLQNVIYLGISILGIYRRIKRNNE